jgi:hypothetical protein
MMLIAAVVLALAPEPLKLVEVERLSPSAAGALLLADRDHGPIEAMLTTPSWAVALPNTVNLELVEKAAILGHGCSRRRWTASFSFIAKPREAAVLSGVWSRMEVALRTTSRCPDAAFAYLNGQIEAEQAIESLEQLDHIRASRGRFDFSCSDGTTSNLCTNAGTIRRELRKLSPWAVMRQGGETIFWLGAAGQMVTEVRYRNPLSKDVIVSRKIPLPF